MFFRNKWLLSSRSVFRGLAWKGFRKNFFRHPFQASHQLGAELWSQVLRLKNRFEIARAMRHNRPR